VKLSPSTADLYSPESPDVVSFFTANLNVTLLLAYVGTGTVKALFEPFELHLSVPGLLTPVTVTSNDFSSIAAPLAAAFGSVTVTAPAVVTVTAAPDTPVIVKLAFAASGMV